MYKPYEGMALELKRMMKASGEKLHRDDLHPKLSDMLEQTIATFGALTGALKIPQDAVMIVCEMLHYLLSHKVIYVPSHFADKMIEADMNFCLSDIKLPRVFEVCFEEGYRLPSTLVVVKPEEPTVKAAHTFVHEAIDEGIALINEQRKAEFKQPIVVTDNFGSTLGGVFSIRFRAADGGICHANIPADEFNGKSVDDAIDSMGYFAETSYGLMDKLSKDELNVQKDVLRVIIGVIAYSNTKNADVTLWRNKNRAALGINPMSLMVGGNLQKHEWYIRSGGPVVLAHERYKRDEEGNVRVIWRKPAEVNKGAKLLERKEKAEEIGWALTLNKKFGAGQSTCATEPGAITGGDRD